MQMPSNPANEKERLAALRQYQILDTESEPEYDDITRLAAQIGQTPMALIMFADEERTWIKSSLEFPLHEMPQLKASADQVILFPHKPLIVPDIRTDERFKDTLLLRADPQIVFFAAVPLTSPDGYTLGCLCLLDKRSRVLSDSQTEALQILARQVIHLLELRKVNIRLESLKSDLEKRNSDLKQFAYVVSHDIKSPLASIVLSTEMLRDHFGENIDEDNNQVLNILDRSSLKIRDLADGVQTFYRSESALSENAETIELSSFFFTIRELFKLGEAIDFQISMEGKRVHLKKTVLELILVNLIQNSLDFNDKPKPIVRIRCSEDESYYHFTVTDNGAGIEPEKQKEIVELFTTNNKRERFGPQGAGVGLFTVKRLVERLSGSIHLKSKLGEGSEFSFTIKKVN
jgi:hypothetical protein